MEHIENGDLRAATFQIVQHNGIGFARPRPRPAQILAGPIQAVLVQKNQLDLFRRGGGAGQQARPPIGGGVFLSSQQAGDIQQCHQRNSGHAGQQAVGNFLIHVSFR